jgi:predicted dehydrogenase
MSNKGIKYIVVGYGHHSSSKIIPLLISMNTLHGVVSSKPNLTIKNVIIYHNLEDALLSNNRKVIFILCSPPKFHFKQAVLLLKNKFNILIEKPIFLKEKEFKEADKIAVENNLFFNELFMYKYSKMYLQFNKIWKKNKKNISRIEITFTIPSFAANSFRNKKNISSSLIYDVGCYPISLLNDLNIDLASITLNKVVYKNNPNKEYFEVSINKDFLIIIKFGIRKKYKNEVKLVTNENSEYTFTPFFHGLKTSKLIKYKKNNNTKELTFNDINSIKKMLSTRTNTWKAYYGIDKFKIVNNIVSLNKIVKQYNKIN